MKKYVILKYDSRGFPAVFFGAEKFQHIVNVKAISESEENLDDKQKAY